MLALRDITERDVATFEAIQRHGSFLWSHYLHEFTKHLGSNATWHRLRLKQLYDAGYLAYHPELKDPRVFNDYFPYILTDKSKRILRGLGKQNVYAVPPGGGPEHAAMTNTITANIELAAKAAGIGYISQEEILLKAPEKTQTSRTPLSLPTTIAYDFNGKRKTSDMPTTPDQLFGLNYGNGFRFYAVEADRGKETLEPSKSFKNSSILRKLLAYQNVFETASYKPHWSIPNLFLLFVTTAEERVNNVIDLMPKVFPKGSDKVLFTHLPGFFHFHKSPPLFPELFGPWKRAGRGPFDIRLADKQ